MCKYHTQLRNEAFYSYVVKYFINASYRPMQVKFWLTFEQTERLKWYIESLVGKRFEFPITVLNIDSTCIDSIYTVLFRDYMVLLGHLFICNLFGWRNSHCQGSYPASLYKGATRLSVICCRLETTLLLYYLIGELDQAFFSQL